MNTELHLRHSAKDQLVSHVSLHPQVALLSNITSFAQVIKEGE